MVVEQLCVIEANEKSLCVLYSDPFQCSLVQGDLIIVLCGNFSKQRGPSVQMGFLLTYVDS